MTCRRSFGDAFAPPSCGTDAFSFVELFYFFSSAGSFFEISRRIFAGRRFFKSRHIVLSLCACLRACVRIFLPPYFLIELAEERDK